MVLMAMPNIIKQYPDAKLYVAGKAHDKKKYNSLKLKFIAYAKGYSGYITYLINKLKLHDNVEFLGQISEQETCERYLKSHLFVLPQAAENDLNSSVEAMILGMPVIAANVGGVSDLIKDKEEGLLYPFNEYYKLSGYICDIFSNDEFACRIAGNAQAKGLEVYDPKNNYSSLMKIYKKIALS